MAMENEIIRGTHHAYLDQSLAEMMATSIVCAVTEAMTHSREQR